MTNNLSPLADQYGQLMAQKAELDKAIKAAKDEILKTGAKEIDGRDFSLTITSASTRWTLDRKAIEAEMGEQWVNERSKISVVSPGVRVKANIKTSRAA